MVRKKKFRKRFRLAFRKRRMILARGVSIIPHLFTLGNGFFGFLSIIFASQGMFASSAYCILIGGLMDALDGRIARMIGVESPLGVELDSLCDAISFCLAPALLVYFSFLHVIGILGIFICAIYTLAGIFRLARFNLISDQQAVYFLGLPTTVAAIFLVAVMLNIKSFVFSVNLTIIFALFMIILPILMVSAIAFPAHKNESLYLKRYAKVVGATIFAIITIFKFKRALLVFVTLYFIWAFWLIIVRKYNHFTLNEAG